MYTSATAGTQWSSAMSGEANRQWRARARPRSYVLIGGHSWHESRGGFRLVSTRNDKPLLASPVWSQAATCRHRLPTTEDLELPVESFPRVTKNIMPRVRRLPGRRTPNAVHSQYMPTTLFLRTSSEDPRTDER